MIPEPPADLIPRGRGRKFWRRTLEEYDASPRETELIAECARMLDQLDRIRDQLEGEPLTVNNRAHPLIVESRLLRAELRLTLAALGFEEGDPLKTAHSRRANRARWSK